jgi:hypothetical protein
LPDQMGVNAVGTAPAPTTEAHRQRLAPPAIG